MHADCLSVPRVARKSFVRLTLNLAGVLLMTRGCACVLCDLVLLPIESMSEALYWAASSCECVTV